MPKTDLSLILRSPSGEGVSGLQERLIPRVPITLARKVARDFVRQFDDASADRYTLYRIDEEQGERLLPLDFGEVAGVLYQTS